MKEKSPAFQFYPADWLSSRDILLMSPSEEGAYIRLLALAWLEPDCGLPDDDGVLSRLSRLGNRWSRSAPKIRAKFRAEGNRLYNDRLLVEKTKQVLWREKSRVGGIATATKRWPQSTENKEHADKGGYSLVKECLQPNCSSSSSSSKEIPPTPFFDLEAGFAEIWDAYPAKGRIKRPDAERWYVEKIGMAVDQSGLHQGILDAVRGKWATSRIWADGYVSGISEFIRLERWQEDPEQTDGGESYTPNYYKPPSPEAA